MVAPNQITEWEEALRQIRIDSDALGDALSPAQFNWRPAPDKWSVGECFDHLAIATGLMLSRVRPDDGNPAGPGQTPDAQPEELRSRIGDAEGGSHGPVSQRAGRPAARAGAVPRPGAQQAAGAFGGPGRRLAQVQPRGLVRGDDRPSTASSRPGPAGDRDRRVSRPMNLSRQLGLGAAVSLVIGEVIAVGIFLTPAQMARSVGSPFWLLVIWLVMGVMAYCGALCYGELAARHPEAGGGYVYLREAYGPGTAFLYGWKCLLVLDPGLTAAFGMGLASYAGFVSGLSASGQKLLAIAAIAVLALVNILGLRFGARVIATLTIAKLGLLGLIILAGFLSGAGSWGNFVPFVAQRPGSLALGAALAGGMVAAFFSFAGWWDAAKLAGEVKDPGRVLPRALGLGVLVVTVVYV